MRKPFRHECRRPAALLDQSLSDQTLLMAYLV
jgi:hypothetical protein